MSYDDRDRRGDGGSGYGGRDDDDRRGQGGYGGGERRNDRDDNRRQEGYGGNDRRDDDRPSGGYSGGNDRRDDDRPSGGYGRDDRRDDDRPSGGYGGSNRRDDDRPSGGYGGSSGGYGGNERRDDDRPSGGYGGNNRRDDDRPSAGYGGNDRRDDDRPSGGYGGGSGQHSSGTSYGGGNFSGSDNYSGAAQHAQSHAGDSGDANLFGTALGMLSDNKQKLQNEDIDEDDAVKQHQKMYGSGGQGDSQASSNNVGAAAAMQALKMFNGSSGEEAKGGQDKFIGMAMAQAAQLFDQQKSQGKTDPQATKQDAVAQAAQMALKFYMKSEAGGSGGGGSSGGVGGLLNLASKFMK